MGEEKKNKKRKKRWLTVKVLLPNGEKRWYCLAKKLVNGVKLEQKLGNKHSFATLSGNYITVPVSGYDQKSHAKLSVGKIVFLHWYTGDLPALYTRSQFVTEDGLHNLQASYTYMRHDYRLINRFRILKSLYYWKKQLRKQAKK